MPMNFLQRLAVMKIYSVRNLGVRILHADGPKMILAELIQLMSIA